MKNISDINTVDEYYDNITLQDLINFKNELRDEMRSGFNEIHKRIDNLEGRISRLEKRTSRVDGHLYRFEGHISRLDLKIFGSQENIQKFDDLCEKENIENQIVVEQINDLQTQINILTKNESSDDNSL